MPNLYCVLTKSKHGIIRNMIDMNEIMYKILNSALDQYEHASSVEILLGSNILIIEY